MKKGFVRTLAFGISILGISILSCKLLTTNPIVASPPEVTATATLSPLEARVGMWQGTTGFGSFSFEVSPDGTEIVNPSLHYESEGGILKGDITLTDPSRFPISEDNSFELNVPDVFIFRVQFSQDGTSASGYWEMIDPIEASENWKIKAHKPGVARVGPVATSTIPAQPTDQPLAEEQETQATQLADIAGVWLETFPGGSAHLEIQADGDTFFKIISGSNKGYQDQGKYWFENGKLNVQTEGTSEIGKYLVYVTRQAGKATSLRYEAIDDPFDARRDAMIYAPLTLLETGSEEDTESPLLPLDILGCNPPSECPESAVSIWSFFEEDEELLPNTEYPVSVPIDTQVRFFVGWCTLEEEMLGENLEQIEFVFSVDGTSLIDQLKSNTYTVQDEQDSTRLNYCHSVGGIVSGWQKDRAYQIIFGMKFKGTIFDGWETYEPGDFTRIYLISAGP